MKISEIAKELGVSRQHVDKITSNWNIKKLAGIKWLSKPQLNKLRKLIKKR
jgi:ribosomal protein S13